MGQGARKTGKPVTIDAHWPKFLPKRFNVTTMKNAGIQGRKTFHSFRHTFKTGLSVTACVDAVMQFRLKRRSRFERFMRRWFPWSQYVRDKELYDSMSAIAARQTARAFLDMPVPPKRPS